MIASALLMMVGAGSAVVADPVPLTFYNRPGATLAEVERDLRRCRLITTGPAAGSERPDGAARLDNGGQGAAPDETIEACMAAYGWRIYALSARERRIFATLDPAARRRAWARLVGRRAR